MYSILFLDNEALIIIYILRRTPEVVGSINKELTRLDKSSFVEPFISLFVAPMVFLRREWLTKYIYKLF